MKINEIVQEGWGNVLGQLGTEFVGSHNVDATKDFAKSMGSRVGSLFKGSTKSPAAKTVKTGTPPPAPVTAPTQATPVTAPTQAAPVPPATPAAKPSVAPAKPAPTPSAPVASRVPTRDQSTMVQQMRQQAGLPIRTSIPAQPTSRAPTRATPTMVQQMRQDAEDRAARASKQSLLKAKRPTYGQPAVSGTPIPLTPAERNVRQPYRRTTQNVYRESVDLAEVLWQKMKRSK